MPFDGSSNRPAWVSWRLRKAESFYDLAVDGCSQLDDRCTLHLPCAPTVPPASSCLYCSYIWFLPLRFLLLRLLVHSPIPSPARHLSFYSFSTYTWFFSSSFFNCYSFSCTYICQSNSFVFPLLPCLPPPFLLPLPFTLLIFVFLLCQHLPFLLLFLLLVLLLHI